MIQRLSEHDWGQVDIIWFLELEYLGRTFRFATTTMDLSDNDTNGFPYLGGLEDVELDQRINGFGGISIEESIAIAITFPNRNLAIDIYNGKILSGCSAQLGFVLVRDGEILQNYESRQIVYKGIVVEPVYGHPQEPLGYVEFSIQNKATLTEQPLLRVMMGDNLYIEDVSISPNPSIGQTPPFPLLDDIVNVADIHRGKVIPFVFGNLTGVLRENANTTNIPISPVYVVAYDTSGAKPCYYIAAGHPTNATSVKVYDEEGRTDTATMLTFVDIDNRGFSYFALDQTSNIQQSVADPTKPGNSSVREVWVEWNDGAPYPNPFGEGDLVGGGDICLFFLQQITDDIDYQAWDSVKNILNQYEFGGYINDDEITIYEFLQKNIVAYLPMTIVNGPNGLKPILDLSINGATMFPRAKITTGAEWYRTSPIRTMTTTEDIINQVSVRYAINGVTNTPTSRCSISNQKSPTPMLQFGLSPLSDLSKNRYGTKRRVIVLEYVYDWKTATKIADDIIQTRALEIKMISYTASLRYGFIDIGDIISITDNDLGFDDFQAQIVGKQFQDNRWIFDIQIRENPYINQRTDV